MAAVTLMRGAGATTQVTYTYYRTADCTGSSFLTYREKVSFGNCETSRPITTYDPDDGTTEHDTAPDADDRALGYHAIRATCRTDGSSMRDVFAREISREE